ncbi:MAG: IclR family transcriptional regulator [Candidatus Protistobacter heckmanni]|nr:IclR family transcriptional regulator [Candidatus Protistobacter heckmanni]
MAAVDRAVSILATFSAAEPVLNLAQLAQAAGLYKSTLLRLIASLIRGEYLVQREDGKYHVGPACLHLSAIYQRTVQPADVIVPTLRELVAASGESASFNIKQRDKRVCLHRVNSPNPISDSVQAGDILELTRGAGGKVLLAFSGEPGTEFDAIRRDIVWCSVGERYPDTAAVACPVFKVGNELAGCLTLSGPKTRFDAASVASMSKLILAAATELTHKLGGDASLFKAPG